MVHAPRVQHGGDCFRFPPRPRRVTVGPARVELARLKGSASFPRRRLRVVRDGRGKAGRRGRRPPPAATPSPSLPMSASASNPSSSSFPSPPSAPSPPHPSTASAELTPSRPSSKRGGNRRTRPSPPSLDPPVTVQRRCAWSAASSPRPPLPTPPPVWTPASAFSSLTSTPQCSGVPPPETGRRRWRRSSSRAPPQ